ncbi:choice-of-anchor D domain-containing protein, partial [Lutibacter sp. HS1-25]|uniref:GEVED domain-containing protein n=1 Tax=Lutibacter sp. HS1-25 TaxID=2485000 RepID=UPI0010111D1B
MGYIKNVFKIIVVAYFFIQASFGYGQVTIASQNFDALPSGLGYAVSDANYVDVDNGSGVSSSNSLRFSNNNGTNNRDSNVIFDNVNISSYSNVTLTISFASYWVDNNEDLFLDISYDNGANYTQNIKLIDGDNNETRNWGTPDSDNQSVDSNPYTFNVPDGNTTIRVRVRANNLDNNEYFYIDNIVITGVLATPADINVLGNGVSILDDDITPSVTDNTDFGSVAIGSSLVKTFTIENSGDLDLNISSITSANSDFVVSSLSVPFSVAAGGSATFDITYTSAAFGLSIAAITIANNDPDIAEQAYTFTVQGSGDYCNSDSTFDSYNIQRVQLKNIDNTSGAGTTRTGYSNFTDVYTTLGLNSTNQITITSNSNSNLGFSVWIDYNKNGNFLDPGEQVFVKPNTFNGSPASGSFTVPSNAVVGKTRMRVSMKSIGVPTSCESFIQGEVEDYTINIINESQNCIPVNINNYNSYIISNVSLGSINNSTSENTGSYTDYTSLATNVTSGGALSGTISVNINGWNTDENELVVWIDFNQDQYFDDFDEKFIFKVSEPNNGSGIKTVVVPISVPIPTSASLGNTRMRIGFIDTNLPQYIGYGPCDFSYNAGEAEDYTVNVTPAVVGFSEVIVSVDWPLYSTENRVEIYSPSGTLIATIDNGFDSSVPNPDVPYATTVNLGCLEDANNYYVIMYDRGGGVNGPGDGWDRNLPNVVSNITITSGGVTVLSNDGWTARSGGVRVDFNVSGGGVCPPPVAGFSEVIVSVDWPLFSTENRAEIYSPTGTLITTIDNGFDSSVPNPDVPYATTVNLGCLEDANNYYVIMYDRGGGVNGPGDGWDRNLPNVVSNITITSGGVTVLSNDGWTARSGGVRVNFNVSGGGVCNNPEAPGGV